MTKAPRDPRERLTRRRSSRGRYGCVRARRGRERARRQACAGKGLVESDPFQRERATAERSLTMLRAIDGRLALATVLVVAVRAVS